MVAQKNEIVQPYEAMGRIGFIIAVALVALLFIIFYKKINIYIKIKRGSIVEKTCNLCNFAPNPLSAKGFTVARK